MKSGGKGKDEALSSYPTGRQAGRLGVVKIDITVSHVLAGGGGVLTNRFSSSVSTFT